MHVGIMSLGLLTGQLEWNTIVDKDLQHSVVTLGYPLSNAPKSSLWVVFLMCLMNIYLSCLLLINNSFYFIYCLSNCGSYSLMGQYDYYGRFCWIYVVVKGIFLFPRALSVDV